MVRMQPTGFALTNKAIDVIGWFRRIIDPLAIPKGFIANSKLLN
jgi:hypothetical protein